MAMLNYQRVLEMSDVTSMDSLHQPTMHLGVSQKRLRPQSRTVCLLQMGHSAPIWIRYIKNYQAKIRPLLGMIPLTSATQKQRQIHHGCHGAEKLKTCVKTMTPMTTQASTKPPPTSHGGVWSQVTRPLRIWVEPQVQMRVSTVPEV